MNELVSEATWTALLGYHCVIVNNSEYDPNGDIYFKWLAENDIHHYKWSYYRTTMKFGFDTEEDKVKFALRWA